MAYTSGFFDAVDQGGGDYDRVYSASTFAHYFSLLVKNGVFPDPSTGMQVKASSSPDMHVSVQPGSGWVNGYYITVENNAPEQLTIPTANPSLSRIDSVIMGLNYVDREIQLYIKSGAVSASPSAVSLQRDNDLYELELAQIAVGAGVASISQTSITDMRQNTSRCGIVAGTIDQIDATDLFAQYDDAFQTWFDDLKAQLGDNVATNLQNQINTLKTDKVNVSDKASTTQAQAGTDNSTWVTPALVKAYMDFILATASEAIAGTIDTKWVSPLKLQQVFSNKKATTAEAQAGTNNTHWVSPADVWRLLVAKKCTSDYIKYYALSAMSEYSGKQITITPSVSGKIGVSSDETTQVLTLTAPLSSLPTNAMVGVLVSVSVATGSGSSGGLPTVNLTAKVTIGSVTTTIGTTTVTGNNSSLYESAIKNLCSKYNLVVDTGAVIKSTDTLTIQITQTKTSTSGSASWIVASASVTLSYLLEE